MSLLSAKKLLLSSGGLRPETRALIDRMAVKPNRPRAKAMDTVIKGLIADGIWPLVDGLYVYAAQDIRDARLNWKQNRWNAETSTNWQADRGFIGADNSATIYYRPANPTDFHMQGYFTQGSGVGFTFYSVNGGNQAATVVNGNTNRRGLTMGSRNVSLSDGQVGDDGAIEADFVGGIYNGAQFILNVRERVTTVAVSGTATGAATERMDLLLAQNAPSGKTVFQSVGRAMTADQMARYRAHIRTYLSTIGAL